MRKVHPPWMLLSAAATPAEALPELPPLTGPITGNASASGRRLGDTAIRAWLHDVSGPEFDPEHQQGGLAPVAYMEKLQWANQLSKYRLQPSSRLLVSLRHRS